MKKRVVVAIAVALLVAGSATFAQHQGRTEQFRFTVTDTGLLLGSCGDFDILWDDVLLLSGSLRYDKNGVLVKELDHFNILGQTRYYNSEDRDKFVLGGPGEVENDHVVYVDGTAALNLFSGLSFKVVLKGYGAIFLQTGHTVYDLQTGEVLFQAGHSAYFDQDLAALCDVLR